MSEIREYFLKPTTLQELIDASKAWRIRHHFQPNTFDIQPKFDLLNFEKNDFRSSYLRRQNEISALFFIECSYDLKDGINIEILSRWINWKTCKLIERPND